MECFSCKQGNWVEDAAMTCPTNSCLNMYCPSVDKIHSATMKPQTRSADFRNNKLAGITGTIPQLLKHDSHKDCKNYSTVTDLVYNHLPKPLCGPDMRYYKKCKHIYYPQPDHMQCVGNVTEWGLRKTKLREWSCTNVSDYVVTEYEDQYVWPALWQYMPAKDRKARNSEFTKKFRYKMTNPTPVIVKEHKQIEKKLRRERI